MVDEDLDPDLDDPQRERVYASEDLTLAHGRTFRRFAEVEAYLADVVSDPWWIDDLGERWGVAPPLDVTLVRRSRSARSSAAEVGRPVIHLRDGHWTAAVLLHELAHLVARDPEPHGPIFCGVLCDLVGRHMGFPASVELRAALVAAGVTVAQPRP